MIGRVLSFGYMSDGATERADGADMAMCEEGRRGNACPISA